MAIATAFHAITPKPIGAAIGSNSDPADALKQALERVSPTLHILRNATAFKEDIDAFHAAQTDLSESGGSSMGLVNPLLDPAVVKADVEAQISHLRKLKIQYLEQNAKDKYTKIIVSDIDDTPIITDDDNKALLALNATKKARLRAAKEALKERCGDLRDLGGFVAEDCAKAQALTSHATALHDKILNARLALNRLRQAHPHPRLTIPAASAALEDQIAEMQRLDGELQDRRKDIERVRDGVRKGMGEVEVLRGERAEVERGVKERVGKEDEARWAPLCDWSNASLALLRSLHGLVEAQCPSENELRLTYLIQPQNTHSSPTSTSHKSHKATIILLFHPNTRQLAAARVCTRNAREYRNDNDMDTGDGDEELEVDMGDVLEVHVQRNDVQGLVGAVLAQQRCGYAMEQD